jgi:hypothetical protein
MLLSPWSGGIGSLEALRQGGNLEGRGGKGGKGEEKIEKGGRIYKGLWYNRGGGSMGTYKTFLYPQGDFYLAVIKAHTDGHHIVFTDRHALF